MQSELGDYAAAKQSRSEGLAIHRLSLPPSHPKIASSLDNLGNVQSELLDYAAAKQSHAEALAIRRKSLPPDHPDIAASLNNLGNVQSELRDYAAAKQCQRKPWSFAEKSLPLDHPDLAAKLSTTWEAVLLLANADPARPRIPLREAISIEQKNLASLAGLQAEAEQLAAVALARNSINLFLSAHLTRAPATDSPYAAILGF